ncbi:hypothetical protein [Legionella sp.]|uniref:hypothetical protein n=1 Tax=Legionella sp. TaxID=459 RepID=UPI00321FD390
MMRDYTKLSPRFWIDETGKKIKKFGIETRLLALYLMSCPHATMTGIYYLPLPFIVHETGLPFEGALKGLQSLCEVGFCQYDEVNEYVWVCEMALLQVGEALKPNDNRVKSLQEAYENLPNLPFLKDFYDKYHAIFHLTQPRENHSPFEGASKPLRSQEQEQDQEQDQKQDQDGSSARLSKNRLPETLCPAAQTDFASQQQGAPISTTTQPSDAVITIPLNDKTEFALSQPQIDEWQVLYPAVDVLQTLRHIRAWNLANPTRCKTRSGILRHVTAWLAKEQNQGGISPPRNKSQPSLNDVNAHNIRVVEEWLSQSDKTVIEGEVMTNPLTRLKGGDYDA